MKIENPAAFSFLMHDDIYLLNADKTGFGRPAKSPSPDVETETVCFNFMGGNKKNFLVVAHYPQAEFIDAPHLEALQNVLRRLGYSLDDIAILNRANHSEADIESLAVYFDPRKMLLLGKKAIPNGMETLTLNIPAQLNNCNTLFSFSFDEMMDNVENKKAFWERMKQL